MSGSFPQRCPLCGTPLRDLERVEAKHTPATVPSHVKGYSAVRRYVIVECDRGHRLRREGGGLFSIDARDATHWNHPRVEAS